MQYFKRIAGAHMGQGANGQIITTSNHVGTHMDGEIHFHSAGRPIGKVPMEEWIGPGVVVDISDEVGDYDLYSPEMLMRKAEIRQGDILIINTGYPPLRLGPAPVATKCATSASTPAPTRTSTSGGST